MATQIIHRNGKRIRISSTTKCSYCEGAKCCHYVTQAIETPRSMYDFSHIQWQVSHDGVEVYKDSDKTWYISFTTTCKKLLPDGHCSIYEKRPQICRDYKNDWCEFDEPASKHWLIHFKDYESVNAYCKKRFKTWQQ